MNGELETELQWQKSALLLQPVEHLAEKFGEMCRDCWK